MIFRILGDLQVGPQDRLYELPRGTTTLRLFAALLIHANKRMSKSELLRAGWGNGVVGEAQLPKHVGFLRTFLDQSGHGDSLKTHQKFGYELRVADDDLDMLVFQRLIRMAERPNLEHGVDEEVDLLRRALALWRGPHVMANLQREWFKTDAERLEQRRMRAAVRLFELELERGNHELILADVAMLASYYPADGRLCEQLMRAQHRCGHSAQALESFDRHREALADLTGGGPDAQLWKLVSRIGQGEESPAARPGRTAHATPRQLPRNVELIGRGHLVAELCWLLTKPDRTVPVVVISGPGGIGKTALAIRVAHRASESYPDGQLYVELGGTYPPLGDTAEVLGQFLRGLGVSEVPETKAERLSMYRTLMAGRQVLVVLDDARDEAQIRDLIPGSDSCGVLITARTKLPDISGVHHTPPLERLGHRESVELFRQVVRGAGIEPQPEEQAAIERVVALCSGLPLALRIAGALRVRDHPRPASELAERLRRQGQEALAYGGTSVARSIGAGFDRLSEPARRLFLGLGVTRLRTFGLWTAAAILDGTGTGTGTDPASALSELTASYMVQPADQDERFRFHDLMREFAFDRALKAYRIEDERHALVREIYGRFLTLVRRAHRGIYGGDYEVVHSPVPGWDAPGEILAEVDSDVRQWFMRERGNVRTVVGHCAELGFADVCWDLAASSHEFYGNQELFDDWYATHAQALEACRIAGDLRGEAVMLMLLGQPALVASKPNGAVSSPADLELAAKQLAECGDQHGLAIALRTLGNALRRRGHLDRPLALFTEALRFYEASGDVLGASQTLRYIGHTHLDRGDHVAALEVLRAAGREAARFGRTTPIAQGNYWIGRASLATGDIDGARAAFNAVREVVGDGGIGYAYAAHGLGDVATMARDFPTAHRLLSAAATEARDANGTLEGQIWLSMAALHAAQGEVDRQISALERAAACFAGCDNAFQEAEAHARLGSVHGRRGDTAAAAAASRRVDALNRSMDLPESDRRHRRRLMG